MALVAYPKALTNKDWQKQKGTLAKSKKTGLGEKLTALEAAHKKIDWDKLTAIGYGRLNTEKEVDEAQKKAMTYYKGSVLTVRTDALALSKKAGEVAKEFKKSKLIPKSARIAAEDISSGSMNFGTALKSLDSEWATFEKYREQLKSGKGSTEVVIKRAADAPKPTKKYKRDLGPFDLTEILTKKEKIKLTLIELPGKHPIDVQLSVEGSAEMEKNAVLHAEFDAVAREVIDDLGKVLANRLTDIDKRLIKGELKPALAEKAIATYYAQFEKAASTLVPAAVDKKFSEIKKIQIEYTQYKVKAGFKLGAKIVGLIASVGATIGGGITGAGAVMGFVGACRTAVEICHDCADLYIKAAALSKEIAGDLTELEKKFAKEDGLRKGGEEIAKDALQRLTGLQSNSVPTIEKNIGVFGNKLKGCKSNAVKAGAKIRVAVKDGAEAKKAVDAVAKEVKGVKQIKSIKKVQAKIDKADEALNTILVSVVSFQEDYNDGRAAIGDYIGRCKSLKEDVPNWAKNIQKYALPFLEFTNATDAASALSSALKVLIELEQTALDVTDEMAEANAAHSLLGDVTSLIEVFA
ncbi:MAG: hypothetical protein ACI89L_001008 [Phycisphaerales bacterium]|jgi:hypothetical protein